jgi:hypothetical protein
MSALPFPCGLSLNHRRATSRPVRAANCNDLLTSIIICLCYGLTASQVDSLDRALSRPFPRAQQAAESRIESSLRDTLPACSSQLSAGVKLVEKRSHRRAPTCSRARCVGDPVPGTSVVPRRAQLHTRLRCGLFGFGAAGGGQQRALASSRSRSLATVDTRPVPRMMCMSAGHEGSCGAESARRSTARSDCAGPRGGAAVVGWSR